jgi:hypothetical protein
MLTDNLILSILKSSKSRSFLGLVVTFDRKLGNYNGMAMSGST